MDNIISLQQKLEQASYSLDADVSFDKSSRGDEGSLFKFVIRYLRLIHKVDLDSFEDRDTLEECLEANSFHYREAQLSLERSGYEQIPVIAQRIDNNRYVILTQKGNNYRLYADSDDLPAYIRIEDADCLFWPVIYEIYPLFPQGTLTLRRLFGFVYPAISRDFLVAGSISILLILISLASPVITAHVVGNVVPSGDLAWMASTFIISVLLSLYQSSFGFLQSFYFTKINQKLTLRLEIPLYARILAYPVPFLDKYAVGDLSSRASSLSSVISSLSSSTLSSLIGSLSLIGYTGLMFYYDAQLSVWALAIIAILLTIEVYFSRRQLHYQKKMIENESGVFERTLQMLSALPQIRTNAAEPFILTAWYNQLLEISAIALRSQRLGDFASSVSSVVNILGMTTLYVVLVTRLIGSNDLQEASVSTTTFIVFTGAFSGFSSRAASLVALFNSLLGSMWVQWQRAMPLIEQSEEAGLIGAKQRLDLSGAIQFDHVRFAYPSNPDKMVLDNISFSIKPGKFNVIFGESGSGKSTILSLILGFYAPSRGAIFVDDVCIDDLDLKYFRRQLGSILQQPTLPPGSIKEAICNGLSVPDDIIWSALEMVNLKDEVEAFPMRLETILSEGASNISGGQKQRLCIARALLNSPSVLLEDEATSALDSQSQMIVTESLKKQGITRIVVAHRLSAVRSCDHMIVLNNASVEYEGTFDECLQHSQYLQRAIAANQGA